MNECVILWRNPQTGRVGFISDDSGSEIAVFPTRDHAIELAREHTILRAFLYQIVELEEL